MLNDEGLALCQKCYQQCRKFLDVLPILDPSNLDISDFFIHTLMHHWCIRMLNKFDIKVLPCEDSSWSELVSGLSLDKLCDIEDCEEFYEVYMEWAYHCYQVLHELAVALGWEMFDSDDIDEYNQSVPENDRILLGNDNCLECIVLRNEAFGTFKTFLDAAVKDNLLPADEKLVASFYNALPTNFLQCFFRDCSEEGTIKAGYYTVGFITCADGYDCYCGAEQLDYSFAFGTMLAYHYMDLLVAKYPFLGGERRVAAYA